MPNWLYKMLGLQSHDMWVKSITKECPECEKETLGRYCSYSCGLEATLKEYEEKEADEFRGYPKKHKAIFGDN